MDNKDLLLKLDPATRLAYYYEYVFNIEILNVFRRTKLQNVTNVNKNNIKNKPEIDYSTQSDFDFLVLIKDNNRKIFKKHIVRGHYNESNFYIERIAGENNDDFITKLYYFVDVALCKYCKKRYIDKNFDEIVAKDEKIRNFIYNND